MNFPCPKCNVPDRGVLLFNLVAPCDTCSGIAPTPEKKLEKYTIHNHRELLSLGRFIRVALTCGEDNEYERDYVQKCIYGTTIDNYTWTDYSNFSTHKDFLSYPSDICVVQWSE